MVFKIQMSFHFLLLFFFHYFESAYKQLLPIRAILILTYIMYLSILCSPNTNPTNTNSMIVPLIMR